MNNHERISHHILSEIEAGAPISQRSLSRELGIALGLTNLLIKRLVTKGFVKTGRAMRGKRIRYLITRKGIAEKTRLSIAYLENTIKLYTETRERIRSSLDRMIPTNGHSDSRRRIIFYGAGDVAEIAFVTLNDSLFDLVGVVDDQKNGQKFFNHSIGSPEDLVGDGKYMSYDWIVVTTFRKSRAISDRIRKLNVPQDRVVFL